MSNSLTNYIQSNGIYKEKENLLKQNYASQQASIDQNKRAQQDAAAIQHQKLLKYLPEYNASMGLRGSGASEGALLEAQARYRSQQGQIAATYDAQKASAEQAHNQNMLNLYTEAEAARKAEQADAYGLAMDTIENWSGSSGDLEKYWKDMEGKLTADQYQSLTQAYNKEREVVVEDEKNQAFQPDEGWEKLKTENTVTATAPTTYEKGKNFKISIGDTPYNVQVGAKSATEGVEQVAINLGAKDGQIFQYKGKLYICSGNATMGGVEVYEIEGRTLNGDGYANLLKDLGLSDGSTTLSKKTGAEQVFPVGAMR